MKEACKILLLLSLLCGAAAFAQEVQSPQIVGRSSAVVNQSSIRLGDIAAISAKSARDDDAVIMLKNITIADSPRPGQEINIQAEGVLEKLKGEGVDLLKVGYLLPQEIKVRRAGRALSLNEVSAAIDEKIKRSNRDLSLVTVRYEGEVQVAPGPCTVEVERSSMINPTEMEFALAAHVPDSESVNFSVRARIKEWLNVPVSKRSLSRGTIVSEGDFVMARLGADLLPRDAALDEDSIVGYRLVRDVGHGEAFRVGSLDIPPVVRKGAQVTMLYESTFFKATATGSALEDGTVDQEIRVRNIGSNKVIRGRIVEPGLVRVGP